MRTLAQQRAHVGDAGVDEGVPSHVVEVVLEGVDDHVARALVPIGDQRLSNGKSRSAIPEADFDHHARVLGE